MKRPTIGNLKKKDRKRSRRYRLMCTVISHATIGIVICHVGADMVRILGEIGQSHKEGTRWLREGMINGRTKR
jgi:hypothetical protein